MEPAGALFEEISRAELFLDNSWKVKQSDRMDQRTSHIYRCRTLADLSYTASAKGLSQAEQLYAIHRWRNFKRHEAWQALLFEQVPDIAPTANSYDKVQDFYIPFDGQPIPFDLKVTRYPHAAERGLNDYELANWFYLNQSRQGRFHLSNRFFVVGEPESALYNLDLARNTVRAFAYDMSKYHHFIEHGNGQSSRTVILRQNESIE